MATNDSVVLSYEELSDVIDSVDNKYPVFKDSLPEEVINRIRADFPGVSDEELGANAQAVVELYKSVKYYEVFLKLKEVDAAAGLGKSQAEGYLGMGVNQQEFWLIFWNPGLKDGTKKAADEALAFAAEKFPNEELYMTRGDGFRHSIWNALIVKYTGPNFDRVSDATAWAQKFTDAHENGASQPADVRDNAMDFHNNNEGRSYVTSVAWVNQYPTFWFFGWQYGYDVYAPETNTIKNAVFSKTLQGTRFSANSQLPLFVGKIVWIY